MNFEGYFYLGKIAKLHGYKGEVSLFLDVTNPSDYNKLERVFVDVDGVLIPFFIDQLKPKNKGFMAVKFQDVNDENAAKKLLKKSIYLPDNELSELDETSFYDHEISGFKVYDHVKGFIGIADTVIDLVSNPLMRIEFENKEILIPIFEGLISKVDRNNRELHIQAPDGLIDLYIS
ncbi:MAG: ribosome maturation factor RimM [Bacteroidota bacterium]